MTAEVISNINGIATVKVSGIFSYAEQLELQRTSYNIVKKDEKIKLLTIYQDFKGWTHDEAWGDVSFQEEADKFIEKMAVVSDEQWKDLILMMVGVGLRTFPIEHFFPDEIEKAKAWLAE